MTHYTRSPLLLLSSCLRRLNINLISLNKVLVHSTDMFPVGTEVGVKVDPFDIQIMKKPESEDEEAVPIEE